MLKITRNVQAGLTLLALLFSLTLFYSCDTVENDVMPKGPTLNLEGSEVYVMPDGTAYIDLYSKVRTNGKITLDIASLPKKGTLTEVATGLLKYSPNAAFTSGRDAFSFSVFGDGNNLLKTDTIDIIVKDSLDLPCSIYPHEDWYYSQQTSVELNVLLNDYICGDSSDVKLEIYRPEENYPPYYGTAIVTNTNTILYTANNVSNVVDRILYKVSRRSDPNVFGFATAYIDRSIKYDTCDHYLDEVVASYQTPNLNYPIIDSLYISLPDTISRCGQIFSDLEVSKAPVHGSYLVRSPGIYYRYELTQQRPSISDSLEYKLCSPQDCLTGRVKIRINE